MKTKFILALVVFCFSAKVHSQNFFIQKSSFGLEAGYIMGEFSEEFEGDNKMRGKMGAYAGAISHFHIEDNFFIKPGVIFSYNQETVWLHLPVFLKYYVTDHLSLVGGPQGTFIVGMKTPYDTFGIDFGAGAAYDITDNIYFEARYNFELTNSRLNDVQAGTNSRYNTIFAGFGYKFL